MLLSLATLAAGITVSDMHAAYGDIFPSHNRNAASHLWSSWVLSKADSLDRATLHELFAGFCPVSGSPVQASARNRYKYSLPLLGSGDAVGFVHHCCTPCVCDTHDLVRVDTKTVTLADGVTEQLNFLVIGDPCAHAAKLALPFVDPFSHATTSLGEAAPEVVCGAGNKLKGATFTDRGGVIIGLLAPELPEPAPGVASVADGAGFNDARSFADFCAERAAGGYASGMGLIFREVAKIGSADLVVKTTSSGLPAPPAAGTQLPLAGPARSPAAAEPTATSSPCDGLLPAARRARIGEMVRSEPVLVLGMEGMRCTDAAIDRLEASSACFVHAMVDPGFEPADEALFAYMRCLHPEAAVGGVPMHSFVFIGGEFVGDGFALRPPGHVPGTGGMSDAELARRLAVASASLSCPRDCDALAPTSERAALSKMLDQPLALLGWSGCPCTNIARGRFEGVGACYVQQVWPTDTAPLYKYLQCMHGAQHHSFVFIGGAFVGDGFALDEARMPQPAFDRALADAGAVHQCQRAGDMSLLSAPLKSCTQANDGSTTGWTRSGSCNWAPSDGGYHEVCVTMSDEFLQASARHDANDLSSVVQPGGHWCICAWAWASAVQRDPQAYEGITLECERTNAKLREVYQSFIDSGADLTSPSGAAYKAKTALDAVDRLCPAPAEAAAAAAAAAAEVVAPSAGLLIGSSAASAAAVGSADHTADHTAHHTRNEKLQAIGKRWGKRAAFVTVGVALLHVLAVACAAACLMRARSRLTHLWSKNDEAAPLRDNESSAATSFNEGPDGAATELGGVHDAIADKLARYASCDATRDEGGLAAGSVEQTPPTADVV